jgi:NadR type nicotinamide-nucleotide adenylyltransferase
MHLVEEAFARCGRLYVATPGNQGPGDSLRTNLVTHAFEHLASCHTMYGTDGMPRDPSEPGFAKKWADTIRANIPNTITRVFSSDTVGAAIVAQELNAEHVVIDTKRQRIPICASDIRADVYGNFRFVAPGARMHLVVSVALLGPESAGKTTLARELSAAMNARVVEDALRMEAAKHRGQLPWESFAHAINTFAERWRDAARESESGVVVLDDSRLLAELWARRLGHKPSNQYRNIGDIDTFDVTLICHDDFGFVGAPERDQPLLRAAMLQEIIARTKNRANVVHIEGSDGSARVETAVAAIKAAMKRRGSELAELLG